MLGGGLLDLAIGGLNMKGRKNQSIMRCFALGFTLLGGLSACQQQTTEEGEANVRAFPSGTRELPAVMGMSTNGSQVMYEVECLRTNRTAIQNETTRTATLAGCAVDSRLAVDDDSGNSRSRLFHDYNDSSWLYYYNPLNYWGNSSNSNSYWCSWLFGGNVGGNCLSWLGYNSPGYTNYGSGYNNPSYNSNCNYCTYYYDGFDPYWGNNYYTYYGSNYVNNQTRLNECLNQCAQKVEYGQGGWNWGGNGNWWNWGW